MRRKLIEIFLDRVQKQAIDGVELLILFLKSSPGSYKELRNHMLYPKEAMPEKYWSEIYREKRVFSTTLSILKKEGIIETKKVGDRSFWNLTKFGLKKYLNLREKIEIKKSTAKNSDGVIIVSYDIPEKIYKERFWLREVLKMLDFTMVQKSLWVGKKSISKEFLKSLEKHDILKYVKIFKVTKSGNLKELE